MPEPPVTVDPVVDADKHIVLRTPALTIPLTTGEAAQLAVDILNVKSSPPRTGLLDPDPTRVISLQIHQVHPDDSPRDLPRAEFTGRSDQWGDKHVVVQIDRSHYLHGYRDAQRSIRNALGVEQ